MRTLIVLALLVLVLLAALRLLRDRIVPFFVFHPEPLRPLESAPSLWGFPQAEEVWIRTADGIRLHGWWFRAREESGRRGVAVLLHGNAGHVGSRGEVGARLAALGFDALLPDYRGYGLSEGSPDEEGLARDAEAAAAYALERTGLPPERLLLVGNSLGSAVAARYAAEHPVGALALVSAFTEAAAVGRYVYPWLPGWMFEWTGSRFETIRHVPRVSAPVLVAVAEHDRMIPASEARAVFEAAPGPKRWVVVRGTGHAEVLLDARLWREVVEFVEAHLPAATRPARGSGAGA